MRGDISEKKLALVFTGDEFADGGDFIAETLQKEKIKASFFLTGRFYRNPDFEEIIRKLKKNGNYLGCHSDQHLLYCDWTKRDSLLVTKQEFEQDLHKNYEALSKFGIEKNEAKYFLPPYEWYNDSIAVWTNNMNLQLINFSAGTRSTADYTFPELKNYRNSQEIYDSIIKYENESGLNGFILLVHVGTDPRRTDKFYFKLPSLIKELKQKGYQFQRIDELLD